MGDNIRLCAVEPRLRLKRSSPQTGLELGTEGGNETGRIASPENEISSLKKKNISDSANRHRTGLFALSEIFLRNSFHFSAVYRSVNYIGLLLKLT